MTTRRPSEAVCCLFLNRSSKLRQYSSPLLPSHCLCLRTMNLAVDIHQLTLEGFEIHTRCGEVRQCVHSVLEDLKADAFCQGLFGHLSTSPLLSKEGPVMTGLVRGMMSVVVEPLRRLLLSLVESLSSIVRNMAKDDYRQLLSPCLCGNF